MKKKMAHSIKTLFFSVTDFSCHHQNNYCDSRCAVVPGGCEQLFYDPTSLPDQWLILSPDTSQHSLLCTESECHFPGPPLHIYPLTVLFLFAVMIRRFLLFSLSCNDTSWLCSIFKAQTTYQLLLWGLTPSWILTVLEHVVPVDPHGTFSVITPKLSSTVLLPHLFWKERFIQHFACLLHSRQRPLINSNVSLAFTSPQYLLKKRQTIKSYSSFIYLSMRNTHFKVNGHEHTIVDANIKYWLSFKSDLQD